MTGWASLINDSRQVERGKLETWVGLRGVAWLRLCCFIHLYRWLFYLLARYMLWRPDSFTKFSFVSCLFKSIYSQFLSLFLSIYLSLIFDHIFELFLKNKESKCALMLQDINLTKQIKKSNMLQCTLGFIDAMKPFGVERKLAWSRACANLFMWVRRKRRAFWRR